VKLTTHLSPVLRFRISESLPSLLTSPDLLVQLHRYWCHKTAAVWPVGKYEFRHVDKKLYQLRPKLSASRVSVASRVVNPKHDYLRHAVSKKLHQLHRKLWVYKSPTIVRFLHSFIVLYIIHNFVFTYRIVE